MMLTRRLNKEPNCHALCAPVLLLFSQLYQGTAVAVAHCSQRDTFEGGEGVAILSLTHPFFRSQRLHDVEHVHSTCTAHGLRHVPGTHLGANGQASDQHRQETMVRWRHAH